MHTLYKIAELLRKICILSGKMAAWLIFALMLVIVADVVLRRWFVIGSTQLQELEWHLHGATFLLCMGWAFVRNSHVRIELLSERLSALARARIELLGCLIFLIPYSIAILYFSFDYAAISYAFDEGSASSTGLGNRWVIKGTMVFGFLLLLLAALERMLACILYLWGGDPFAARYGALFKPHTDEAL